MASTDYELPVQQTFTNHLSQTTHFPPHFFLKQAMSLFFLLSTIYNVTGIYSVFTNE